MSEQPTLEVTIKGQDRRHAVDMLMRAIEDKRRQFGADWYGARGEAKILNEQKFPQPLRSALSKLRALDLQLKALQAKNQAAADRVKRLLGDRGRLDTKFGRGNWKEWVVKETDRAAHERINGNELRREQKRKQLDDLKERLVLALVNDLPLEPIVKEFKTIGGKF